MSFFRRAREVTADLAATGKRQAQRGKLELEVRRLESKVNAEKLAIGQLLLPLLKAGTLQVDLPEVEDHVKAIDTLTGEIGERRAEVEALGHAGNDDASKAATNSIANIDKNATSKASDDQSASDARAKACKSPAEEGGQG